MILLQILNEGTVTNSQGRKVDFKVCSDYGDFRVAQLLAAQNTIICLMSNIGGLHSLSTGL